MELKSQHLEWAAIVVLITGLILGLASGNIFPTLIEKTKHVNHGGMILMEPYFETAYNTFLAISVMVSSVMSALILWYFSTVLFHLEKNRNFNRKAIELLEKIVEQQVPCTTVALEQPAKVTTAK